MLLCVSVSTYFEQRSLGREIARKGLRREVGPKQPPVAAGVLQDHLVPLHPTLFSSARPALSSTLAEPSSYLNNLLLTLGGKSSVNYLSWFIFVILIPYGALCPGGGQAGTLQTGH